MPRTDRGVGYFFCLLALWLPCGVGAQGPVKRPIRYSDVPAALQDTLAAQGVSGDKFPAYIESLNQNTAERVQTGEAEHLVYFALQSSRFTRRRRIEPAESARAFITSLKPPARDSFLKGDPLPDAFLKDVPADVNARMQDLATALRSRKPDSRLAYFSGWFAGSSQQDALKEMRRAYAEAMRFLYRKEFLSAQEPPAERAAFVSSLYQQRGHSTDTQLEANFPVWTALAALRSLNPTLKLRSVLIIGPGLDFAPRTDLMDAFEPQSYQPYAVADALLQLKLAEPGWLSIQCADINPRVVRFLDAFPRGERTLRLISGLRRDALSSEFADYFAGLGKALGTESPLASLPAPLERHFTKLVKVRPEIAAKITAEAMNVITERYGPAVQFDVVIVTNVFLYFNRVELALALANIQSMLKPGGLVIHNEVRTELEELGRKLGLSAVQARTLLLSAGPENRLLDSFVIHQRK